MNATRPTLPQRVTAVLRAREYVVFFAIGLFALDLAVPILSGWIRLGGPFSEIMYDSWGPLADSIAARSALVGAVWIVYVLAMTWLRAGYIRSLAGPVHFRPASGRQFLSLLAFEVALEVVGALAAWGLVAAGEDALTANLVAFGQLAVYFVVMYADYIIVLGGTGPLQGIRLSWRMVRLRFLLSAAIMLVVTLVGQLSAGLFGESVLTSLARALPMLLVQVVAMGALIFVADIVLVVLYQSEVESGRLEPKRRGDERLDEGPSPPGRG
jgi:hypothetical protein